MNPSRPLVKDRRVTVVCVVPTILLFEELDSSGDDFGIKLEESDREQLAEIDSRRSVENFDSDFLVAYAKHSSLVGH